MLIIGHRGAKGLAPENTIAGLRKALQHGADAVEFDVRVTKDQIAVLNHDVLLRDAGGRELSIRENEYAKLKAHKPDLPTLAEALIAIDRKVPALVELKPGEPAGPVINVVTDLLARGWTVADISFISFDYRVLRELKAALPGHQLIVDELWSSVRAAYRAKRLGTRHISLYRPFIWSGFIRAASRRGYKVYVFPCNDPGQAKRWERAGLHAVVTDYPDRFEN